MVDGADRTMIDCINALSVMPSILYKVTDAFIFPTLDIGEGFIASCPIRGGYPLSNEVKAIVAASRIFMLPVLTTINGNVFGSVFQYFKGFTVMFHYYFHDEASLDDVIEDVDMHLRYLLDLKIPHLKVIKKKIQRDISPAMSTLAIPSMIFSEVIDRKTVDTSLIDYHCTAALAEFRALVYGMSKGTDYKLKNAKNLKGTISFLY